MMDFLCMQWMHCQSLPFNAIKRSFMCFTFKLVCRILLNFWVLLNRGFHYTASLFKFVSFQSAHKKTAKQLLRAFRLKDFANFTTQKTDSESTCFSDYANSLHFSNFLADNSVPTFTPNSASKWIRTISIKNFKFLSLSLIDSFTAISNGSARWASLLLTVHSVWVSSVNYSWVRKILKKK